MVNFEELSAGPKAPTFEEFPKIARFFREVVVTEKIDGTNAQILITEDGAVIAGSRNRFITQAVDNHGFARWVKVNEDELRVGLGFGTHYGEWWGSGIQRGYGLVNGEKRFSLFNVGRWHDVHGTNPPGVKSAPAPACCWVVPVLWSGLLDSALIRQCLADLSNGGSKAAPGFMKPEGVVVFHTAGSVLFKATLEKDDEHKGVRG